ncbi:hypothetical protein LJR029_004833 [Caballeronia sp. LjRoot29]|uniref:hypothetical protein n=1 Tax=unclassified Caballeronia TaxID=2646786 RepID=UPI0039E6736B
MNKATSTLIAAVAALTLSGGAYAQSNNSLARPSVTSPVAATGGGYGTPGDANSDSGHAAASSNSGTQNSANGSTPAATVWPSNNSLARPSVVSPAAGQ